MFVGVNVGHLEPMKYRTKPCLVLTVWQAAMADTFCFNNIVTQPEIYSKFQTIRIQINAKAICETGHRYWLWDA